MEVADKSWLFFTPGTVQSMNVVCAMLPETASVMVMTPRCAWHTDRATSNLFAFCGLYVETPARWMRFCPYRFEGIERASSSPTKAEENMRLVLRHEYARPWNQARIVVDP